MLMSADWIPASTQHGDYQVTLTLSVEDLASMWVAAAARLLAAPGMTIEDVEDTIGPSEDPSIVDCIAALTAPVMIAGCTIQDLKVEAPEPVSNPVPAAVAEIARRLAG